MHDQSVQGCGVWKKLSGRIGKKRLETPGRLEIMWGENVTKVAMDIGLIIKVNGLAV